MEAKSKFSMRKDLSGVATPRRSTRRRLNGSGDRSDGSAVPVENRIPVVLAKDLRVHRVFSPVSVGGRDGESERNEVVQDCVQATPHDEVLGVAKVMDASGKSSVTPTKGFGRQLAARRSPGSKVLKPCPRTKLSGDPSSFSYRRLLPYLMDITKGAFEGLDMKPQLPKTYGNSVVESSLSTLEPKFSCEPDSSSLRQVPSPSKISDPNICTENTADTEVPINSSFSDLEVSVSASSDNLCDGQPKVSVKKNDKLSQLEAGNVMEVHGGMTACGDGEDAQDTVNCEAMNDSICVDYATQQSPDENQSDLMDVLEDALLCKSLDSSDVHATKKNDAKYEEPLRNILGNNSTAVAQETPLDNEVSTTTSKDHLGIVKCVLKPNGVIPSTRNSDHEQLAVTEVRSIFSSVVVSDSGSVDSAIQLSSGESRSEQTNVLGNGLSCKHLDLSDAHEQKENVVNYDKPKSAISSPKYAELVQRMLVSNEDYGKNDVTVKGKPTSKTENQLDDSVITKAENSVCEQFNGSADSKQPPSSDTKRYLKPHQLKRFKNYNSVSYRKLLPYLTEIFEDSAGSSNKGHPKIDGAPAFVGDSIKKGNPTSASGTALRGDSSPISAASCDVEPELTNSECFSEVDGVTDSPTVSNLENGLTSPIELQIPIHDQGQSIQCPSSSCGPRDMLIGELVEKSQCAASTFKEEEMTRNNEHYDDSGLSNIVSVYPEPISTRGRAWASPTRGILKKNPRGCRGLCTCLRCASFRLHAEKAFEFSRNQLLDCEEMALELINELSLLRNLLKDSTDTDGGETSKVIEACKRADAIEQHAKAQFEQMNHDLRSHCQIPNLQRPTVNFARHLEEKLIPAARH